MKIPFLKKGDKINFFAWSNRSGKDEQVIIALSLLITILSLSLLTTLCRTGKKSAATGSASPQLLSEEEVKGERSFIEKVLNVAKRFDEKEKEKVDEQLGLDQGAETGDENQADPSEDKSEDGVSYPTATPTIRLPEATPTTAAFAPSPTPTSVKKEAPTSTPTSFIPAGPTPTPTLTPTPQPTISLKPDLIITDASVFEPPMRAAHWTYIMVTIKNQGDAKNLGMSNIQATLTGPEGNMTGCEVGLETLNPGESYSTSIYCITYKAGTVEALIEVDANNAVSESNESNNSYRLNIIVAE